MADSYPPAYDDVTSFMPIGFEDKSVEFERRRMTLFGFVLMHFVGQDLCLSGLMG